MWGLKPERRKVVWRNVLRESEEHGQPGGSAWETPGTKCCDPAPSSLPWLHAGQTSERSEDRDLGGEEWAEDLQHRLTRKNTPL